LILALLPLLLALLILLAAPASTAAQSTAASPPEGIPLSLFLAEIDRLIAEVSAVVTAVDAQQVAATIPERWRVLAAGQRVDVSAGWLSAALTEAPRQPDQWRATRDAIRRRLIAVREQAAALADADGAQARARARTTVETILARVEFQQSAASRWAERLQQRIGKWFEELWARLGGGGAAGRTAAVALAWAAALAALLGLGFWLARTIAERPRGASLDLGPEAGARPRARELALRALAEARAGNARESVRIGYNAAVVRLEEQGAWGVEDARTPREYLRILQNSDARHASMLDLTQRFEQIWYGNRTVAADDTPRVTAHLEALGCLRPGERAI